MDFVEDVTPHQLRHAAIPNETVDFWERRDLLALGELTSFIRHSADYGMTLTKMTNRCPGNSRKTMSEAYNKLLAERFAIRIEFTYARPAGTNDRSGQRYTKHCVSRTAISEDRFAELVSEHAPGKYVLIPYDGEKRRVKILAAEIYCHLGAGKITSETQIVPHEQARGGKAKKKQGSYAATEAAEETPDAATEAAEETPDAATEAAEETPDKTGSPESTRLTSGASCENADDPQVAPESTPPDFGRVDSITKYGERTTDTKDGAARALPTVGCGPSDPTGAARIDEAADPNQTDHAPSPGHAGELQTARAEMSTAETRHSDHDRDTLTRDQARDIIQQTLNTKPRTTNTSHPRNHTRHSVRAEND